MAERRMFTKKVTDSDAFIEMPSASQALYFHLNQGADDDGFNNQIQLAMLKAHASTDDLKILMTKNFVIRFESGVIVIKHWRMHNTLRKDRYTPTNFQEELRQLGLKENGSYTFGCQTVAKRLPQYSIGKESIEEDSIDKVIIKEKKGKGDLSNILKEYNFSFSIEEKINEWLKYKKEKNQSYKPTGFRTFLKKIENAILEIGEQEVLESIDNCIASNYSGLFFNKPTANKPYSKKESVSGLGFLQEMHEYYQSEEEYGNN